MSIYKPTWLYIKQHNITRLKYFGKTIRDPYKYRGSGVYWINHIKKHGNDVSTIWCEKFDSKQMLTEYAVKFSIDNNIVECETWANLKIEDGLDGGNKKGINKGIVRSNQTKKLLSDINKGKKMSVESSMKKSKKLLGRIFSEEHLHKLSESAIGRKKTDAHRLNITRAKKGKPWTENRRNAYLNRKNASNIS